MNYRLYMLRTDRLYNPLRAIGPLLVAFLFLGACSGSDERCEAPCACAEGDGCDSGDDASGEVDDTAGDVGDTASSDTDSSEIGDTQNPDSADTPDGDASIAPPVSLPAFTRVTAGALTDFWVPMDTAAEGSGSGYGLCAGDFDNDMDDDVVVADNVAGLGRVCVFENVSSPGRIDFADSDGRCLDSVQRAVSCGLIDLAGDGRGELVLAGAGSIVVYDQDFLAGVVEPRQSLALPGCLVSSISPVDANADGSVDLIVSCYAAHADALLLLEGDGTGGLLPPKSVIPRLSQVYAMGIADLDENGLSDWIVVSATPSATNDFSVPEVPVFNTLLDPGGVYSFEPASNGYEGAYVEFGDGLDAYGAYMGAGIFTTVNGGRHLLVTDWGPNRIFQLSASGITESLSFPELGLGRAEEAGADLSNWAVLTADLNGDRLDDLIIGQGTVYYRFAPGTDPHRDRVALQRSDGSFEVLPLETVLATPEVVPTGLALGAWSTRGGFLFDADLDGGMELILAGAEGPPRLYAEDVASPDDRRCTVIPRPRVVLAEGSGYEFLADESSPASLRSLRGQVFTGPPSSLLAASYETIIQFPSGARVPFECPELGQRVVEVNEPDWLQVTRAGDQVRVEIDSLVWGHPTDALTCLFRDQNEEEPVTSEVTGTIETDGEGGTALEASCTLPDSLQSADSLMLRIGDRWVHRWLGI